MLLSAIKNYDHFRNFTRSLEPNLIRTSTFYCTHTVHNDDRASTRNPLFYRAASAHNHIMTSSHCEQSSRFRRFSRGLRAEIGVVSRRRNIILYDIMSIWLNGNDHRLDFQSILCRYYVELFMTEMLTLSNDSTFRPPLKCIIPVYFIISNCHHR